MLRLKEIRKSKGMSQADVAKLLGITQQAYANYERGVREADYKALKKLSDIFECSIDYLLGQDILKYDSDESFIYVMGSSGYRSKINIPDDKKKKAMEILKVTMPELFEEDEG